MKPLHMPATPLWWLAFHTHDADNSRHYVGSAIVEAATFSDAREHARKYGLTPASDHYDLTARTLCEHEALLIPASSRDRLLNRDESEILANILDCATDHGSPAGA